MSLVKIIKCARERRCLDTSKRRLRSTHQDAPSKKLAMLTLTYPTCKCRKSLVWAAKVSL